MGTQLFLLNFKNRNWRLIKEVCSLSSAKVKTTRLYGKERREDQSERISTAQIPKYQCWRRWPRTLYASTGRRRKGMKLSDRNSSPDQRAPLASGESFTPAMFKHRVNPEKPPGKKARQMAKKQVNMVRDERQEMARRRKQYSSIQKSTARLREFGVDISAQLPDIEAEKEERKKRMIKEGRTPVMAVDDSDLDITLKTPPNVRKIKSRQNSAALSGATPISGKFKSGGKNRELLVAKTATPTIDEVVKKKSKLFSAKKSKKL